MQSGLGSDSTLLNDARLSRLLTAGCPSAHTCLFPDKGFYLKGRVHEIACRPAVETELANASNPDRARIVRALVTLGDETDIPSVAYQCPSLRGERCTTLHGIQIYFYPRPGAERRLDVFLVHVLDDGSDDDGGEAVAPPDPHIDWTGLIALGGDGDLRRRTHATWSASTRCADAVNAGAVPGDALGFDTIDGNGAVMIAGRAWSDDLGRLVEIACRKAIFVSLEFEQEKKAANDLVTGELFDYDVSVLSTLLYCSDFRLVLEGLRRPFGLRFYEYQNGNITREIDSPLFDCTRNRSRNRAMIGNNSIPLDIVMTYEPELGWTARIMPVGGARRQRGCLLVGATCSTTNGDTLPRVVRSGMSGREISFVMRIKVRRRMQ